MFRKSNGDITDAEFEKIIIPFNKNVDDYILKYILYDFVAFYIASGYERSVFSKTTLKTEFNTAVEVLGDCNSDQCFDSKKIADILQTKFSLKIVSEKPLKLEKIEYKL